MHPNSEMKGFLQEHMEFDQMIDEVMTAWEMLAERETGKRSQEEDKGGEIFLQT